MKEQLARLEIVRTIFHDVPVRSKSDDSIHPILMEEETKITAEHEDLLRNRIVRALGSSHGYEVMFDPSSTSPIPQLIQDYLNKQGKEKFIASSRTMATHLFNIQNRANSPGLFSLMDCTLAGSPAVAVLKIEREEGTQIKPGRVNGKSAYDMEVLRNLFFTDGTRLFKSAVFVRNDPEEYSILACDDQRGTTSDMELARFFLTNFLGCMVIQTPKTLTKWFFNAATEYFDTYLDTPTSKNDSFNHLTSQMKSNAKTLNPKDFAKEFLPLKHQGPFLEHLQHKRIPISKFEKDTTEINRFLKKKLYRTKTGVTVTAPQETADNVIAVSENKIVITDRIISIGK